MNKVVFIGNKRIGILLKSFGIDHIEANDKTEAINKIKAEVKANRYTVILTEETFFETVKSFLEKKTDPIPVIMMLPTATISNNTVKMIGEVVEKAVGIDILAKSEN